MINTFTLKKNGIRNIELPDDTRFWQVTFTSDALLTVCIGDDVTVIQPDVPQTFVFSREKEAYVTCLSPCGVIMVYHPVKDHYEPHSDVKIVEELSPDDVSLYDRLRADMVAMLSDLADKQDYDTIEEADDFDIDDDVDDFPNTPYEFAELDEEYLEPHPNDAGYPDESLGATPSSDDSTPNVDQDVENPTPDTTPEKES